MGATLAIYVAAMLVGLAKFKRFANVHSYSSRIASVPLYAFMARTLIAEHYAPILLCFAVGLFTVSSTERLPLLLTSTEATDPVGSALLVWRARGRK